jgi:hypothetical protein
LSQLGRLFVTQNRVECGDDTDRRLHVVLQHLLFDCYAVYALGPENIQSLADLGNSYSLVRDMRSIPFGLEDISRLAAATAAPLLPLLLTIFSPEELIMRIIKVLF